MILAAGRGERMRPLTEHTPKPLLTVAGRPLIEHHLHRLAAEGFRELVINVSHLGDCIEAYCGDGRRWGLAIRWSREEQPLETAGGIARALPLLGEDPFLVVNADIWIDFPFARLRERGLAAGLDAHLLMVNSPPQHPLGDFCLRPDGLLRARAGEEPGLTYAGVGLYRPGWFGHLEGDFAPLRPMLDRAVAADRIGGERHAGEWEDVGTPERLRDLDRRLRARV